MEVSQHLKSQGHEVIDVELMISHVHIIRFMEKGRRKSCEW